MKSMLLASVLSGKCGVFWSQVDAEVEAFQLYLSTATYGYNEVAEGKSEYWTVVLTMVHVI